MLCEDEKDAQRMESAIEGLAEEVQSCLIRLQDVVQNVADKRAVRQRDQMADPVVSAIAMTQRLSQEQFDRIELNK